MNRRNLLAALASGIGLLAGCTASPGGDSSPGTRPDGTPTETPPAARDTPTPTGTDGPSDPVTPSGSPAPSTETPTNPYETFPEGPKEPPERPATSTLDSIREFVRTFEYRYVYNTMWVEEGTEVDASCEVRRATETASGYRVVVSCTAYSTTGGDPRETGTGTTTVVHGDWFTQTFLYVVTPDSVSRRRYDGESTPATTTPPGSTATAPPTPTRTPREADR